MNRPTILTTEYHSPCGTLLLGAAEGRLCLCDWLTEPHHPQVLRRLRRLLGADFRPGTCEITETAAAELNEYFGGLRRSFTVPLLTVGTPFQNAVWEAIAALPYGAKATYTDIARSVGRSRGVRAAASAVGANALSVFVPCHRIVHTSGTRIGYAGGPEAKQFLLDLERSR